MPAINDVTKSVIQTSSYSKEGRKNHDRIFAKKSANEWAREDKIMAIYGGLFEDINAPISYSEFIYRMDLKNKLK